MTRLRLDRADEGFTLVELLIAVFIMSVAGIAIASGMETLGYANANHRGLAMLDGITRSYEEAITHRAELNTTLTTGISATDGSLQVRATDAPWLPTGAFEVAVDGEQMAVSRATGSSTLSISTRGDNTTLAIAHPAGAALSPVYSACPTATDIMLQNIPFAAPPHVASLAVLGVDYWLQTPLSAGGTGGSWTSTNSQCLDRVHTNCSQYTASLAEHLPECWPGVIRVRVSVTGDAVYHGAIEQTHVIVRRGNL